MTRFESLIVLFTATWVALTVFILHASAIPVDVDPVDPLVLDHALAQSRYYLDVLRFPYPVDIRVVPSRYVATAGYPNRVAFVARDGGGLEGCVVYTSARGLRTTEEADRTIAHECCHCALDYAEMGPWAYRTSVSEAYADWMEARAGVCENWLTDESTEVDMERREGKWPWMMRAQWAGSRAGK